MRLRGLVTTVRGLKLPGAVLACGALVSMACTQSVPGLQSYQAWFETWYLRNAPVLVLADGSVVRAHGERDVEEVARLPEGWRTVGWSVGGGDCLLVSRLDPAGLGCLETLRGWTLTELPISGVGKPMLPHISSDGQFVAFLAQAEAPRGGAGPAETGVYVFDRLEGTLLRLDPDVPMSEAAKRESRVAQMTWQTLLRWPGGRMGLLLSRSAFGQARGRYVWARDSVLWQQGGWTLLRDSLPWLPEGILHYVDDNFVIVEGGRQLRLFDRLTGRSSDLPSVGGRSERDQGSVSVAPGAKWIAVARATFEEYDEAVEGGPAPIESTLRILRGGQFPELVVEETTLRTAVRAVEWDASGDRLLLNSRIARSDDRAEGVEVSVLELPSQRRYAVYQGSAVQAVGWLRTAVAGLAPATAQWALLGAAGAVGAGLLVVLVAVTRSGIRRSRPRERGLGAAALCEACGARIQRSAKFCTKCGKKLAG